MAAIFRISLYMHPNNLYSLIYSFYRVVGLQNQSWVNTNGGNTFSLLDFTVNKNRGSDFEFYTRRKKRYLPNIPPTYLNALNKINTIHNERKQINQRCSRWTTVKDKHYSQQSTEILMLYCTEMGTHYIRVIKK